MRFTRTSLFSCCGGLIVGMLANLRGALASTSLPDRQEYAEEGDVSHRIKMAAQERRYLQSTCSAENAFTITSSLLPLTEGCYFHDNIENKDIYLAETAFVYSEVIEERSNDEYWVLAENEDGLYNSEGTIVCLSKELFEDVIHPADATWECDIDGDSMADELTATEFSISCGCSETPPPTAAPIRVLPVNGTCGEPLDEILVKSTFNPDLEGCYKETPSTMMDLPTYTVSGTNASEQIFMRAQQQDSSTSVNWILAYQPMDENPDDFVYYCYSEEEAEDVHPSEVETWFCDTDDDVVSDPVTVQWTVFDVLCGCTPSSSSSSSSPPSSSSSSSLDSSADVPYPAPTPYQFSSSSVSFKCGGAKDQFQITSAELSEVYGECFIAANESNSNGTITYSSDGTTYVGQFVVIPAEDPDGNVRWLIAFVSLDGEYDQYYYSREEAATVHPTEATWDILPDADITVSGPTNLVVDCGCQNLTAFTADSSATTPKLSIALPAMVWAIMTVIVCMVYLSVSEP